MSKNFSQPSTPSMADLLKKLPGRRSREHTVRSPEDEQPEKSQTSKASTENSLFARTSSSAVASGKNEQKPSRQVDELVSKLSRLHPRNSSRNREEDDDHEEDSDDHNQKPHRATSRQRGRRQDDTESDDTEEEDSHRSRRSHPRQRRQEHSEDEESEQERAPVRRSGGGGRGTTRRQEESDDEEERKNPHPPHRRVSSRRDEEYEEDDEPLGRSRHDRRPQDKRQSTVRDDYSDEDEEYNAARRKSAPRSLHSSSRDYSDSKGERHREPEESRAPAVRRSRGKALSSGYDSNISFSALPKATITKIAKSADVQSLSGDVYEYVKEMAGDMIHSVLGQFEGQQNVSSGQLETVVEQYIGTQVEDLDKSDINLTTFIKFCKDVSSRYNVTLKKEAVLYMHNCVEFFLRFSLQNASDIAHHSRRSRVQIKDLELANNHSSRKHGHNEAQA